MKMLSPRAQCLVVVLASALVANSLWPAAASDADEKRFRHVEPGFWRGGLPRKSGLEQLKKMGVRTVVDLMDEDPAQWRQIAEGLGMKYVNIPLRRTRPIPIESIQEYLKVVEDPANKPLYVHCRSGRDRTGAMVAIYRIDAENWSSADACKEMRSCGFNPMFRHLSKSVVTFKPERLSQPRAGTD